MNPKRPTTVNHETGEPVLFPIRILSQRTGVGTSTLRAWERRYGLLQPQRTPKGHRLYTAMDAARVERILELLGDGHSLPSIAVQLKQGVTDETRQTAPGAQTDIWEGYHGDTLRAVADFSTGRLERLFNEATSLYPVEMVTDRLIIPVLRSLGDAWQNSGTAIAEEHFYTAWVRNRLGARFHHAGAQADGARLLCAGLPHSFHEIGLLLFALSALNRGYRVLYLGENLPLDQVARVSERSTLHGVVLSSRETIDAELEASLVALTDSLGIPVLLGGPCSDRPLDAFESAGGVRLGSQMAVALQVLASHIPLHTTSRR